MRLVPCSGRCADLRVTLAGGVSSIGREIMAGLGMAWRRHRGAVAANLALVLALGGVVYYAVSADGYRSHHAELNDGGIWATNPTVGYFGRVNKQIGQYDGAVFADSGAALDIVQQGSAVVGVNLTSRRIAPIDPSTVSQPAGEVRRRCPPTPRSSSPVGRWPCSTRATVRCGARV